jgi:outer membrane protein
MKNFSTIIQVILVLAVIGLYVLHFTDNSVPVNEDGGKELLSTPVVSSVNGGVVFINSDSLLDNYIYFKNKKTEYESRQNRIKSELESESSKIQKDAESYQLRAPGMTDMQRQIEEEQLMMRQQKLMQRKDELFDKLDEEQSRSSEELYDKLAKYLKEYNKDKNYQFIFGYQKGGGILFANDSLDITNPVLKGLNEEFDKEKSK